jgi:hypothetical protein
VQHETSVELIQTGTYRMILKDYVNRVDDINSRSIFRIITTALLLEAWKGAIDLTQLTRRKLSKRHEMLRIIGLV